MQYDQPPESASPPNSDDQYGHPLAQAITEFVPSELLKRVEVAFAAWKAAGSPQYVLEYRFGPMTEACDYPFKKPCAEFAELNNAAKACAEEFHRLLRFSALEAFWCADPTAGDWKPWRPDAWDYLKINIGSRDLQQNGALQLFVGSNRRQHPHVRVRRKAPDRSAAPETSKANTDAPKSTTQSPARRRVPGRRPSHDWVGAAGRLAGFAAGWLDIPPERRSGRDGIGATIESHFVNARPDLRDISKYADVFHAELQKPALGEAPCAKLPGTTPDWFCAAAWFAKYLNLRDVKDETGEQDRFADWVEEFFKPSPALRDDSLKFVRAAVEQFLKSSPPPGKSGRP